MFKQTLINTANASYSDEELSKLTTLLLKNGRLGTGFMFNVGTGMDIKLAQGFCIMSFVNNAKTFNIIVENTADLTVTVASNISGSTVYDHYYLKTSVGTEPNSFKNNIVSLEKTRKSNTTALTDSDMETLSGATNTYLYLGYITIVNNATSIISGTKSAIF